MSFFSVTFSPDPSGELRLDQPGAERQVPLRLLPPRGAPGHLSGPSHARHRQDSRLEVRGDDRVGWQLRREGHRRLQESHQIHRYLTVRIYYHVNLFVCFTVFLYTGYPFQYRQPTAFQHVQGSMLMVWMHMYHHTRFSHLLFTIGVQDEFPSGGWGLLPE